MPRVVKEVAVCLVLRPAQPSTAATTDLLFQHAKSCAVPTCWSVTKGSAALVRHWVSTRNLYCRRTNKHIDLDQQLVQAGRLGYAEHKLEHGRTGVQAWQLCTLMASADLPDISPVAGIDCAQSRQSQETSPAQAAATSY